MRHPLRAPATLAPSCVLALALLAGCGGGTEIAPSNPDPVGTGSATGAVAGVDLGSTRLVTTVADGLASGQRTTVTDETAVVGADGIIRLANGNLLLDPIVLNEVGPPPGPVLEEGPLGGAGCGTCDFWIADQALGALRISPTGALQPGDVVQVDYVFDRKPLNLQIGVTFAPGRAVTINVYNVDADATGPLTVTQVAASWPSDFSTAFNFTVQADLAEASGTTFAVFDDDLDPTDNVLEITSIDLSNPVDPCIAGRLTGVLIGSGLPPSPITLVFSDLGC